MTLSNKWASDLIGKDRKKANQAAQHIVDNSDIEAWKCLVENAEYLFGYIKERAAKNLAFAVNDVNLNNLLGFLKYHSPDWDYYIAEIFCKFSGEELNVRFYELLQDGTVDEQAYAAKYFSLTKYDEAISILFKKSKSDYQSLKINAAEALGNMNDQQSFEYYLDRLNSEDDWEKVESAQFLSSYGNKEAVIPILKSISNSGMAEYLAGEAASLDNLASYLDHNDIQVQILALKAFDNIISGLAEIWTLSALFDFNVYEFIEKLISLSKSEPSDNMRGIYAQILLKSRAKLSLFMENSQYTFDEEKTVLNELDEIYHLLVSEDDEFWDKQVNSLALELIIEDEPRKIASIRLIGELGYSNLLSELLDILKNRDESEIVLCETVTTVVKLGAVSQISDRGALLYRINDKNLLAIIENAIGNLNKA